MRDEMLKMSSKEVNRLKIIEKTLDKRLSQKEAAKLLDISERHFRYIKTQYIIHGAHGLVSKRLGKKSNNSF